MDNITEELRKFYDQKERESYYEQREREELRRRERRLRDLQELRMQFQRENQRDYSREDFVPQDPESIKRYEDGVLDSAIKKYGPQGDTRYLTPEEARILKKRMLEQDLERFKEEEPLPPPPKPRKPRGQTAAKGGPIKQYAKGGGVRKPRTL